MILRYQSILVTFLHIKLGRKCRFGGSLQFKAWDVTAPFDLERARAPAHDRLKSSRSRPLFR